MKPASFSKAFQKITSKSLFCRLYQKHFNQVTPAMHQPHRLLLFCSFSPSCLLILPQHGCQRDLETYFSTIKIPLWVRKAWTNCANCALSKLEIQMFFVDGNVTRWEWRVLFVNFSELRCCHQAYDSEGKSIFFNSTQSWHTAWRQVCQWSPFTKRFIDLYPSDFLKTAVKVLWAFAKALKSKSTFWNLQELYSGH